MLKKKPKKVYTWYKPKKALTDEDLFRKALKQIIYDVNDHAIYITSDGEFFSCDIKLDELRTFRYVNIKKLRTKKDFVSRAIFFDLKGKKIKVDEFVYNSFSRATIVNKVDFTRYDLAHLDGNWMNCSFDNLKVVELGTKEEFQKDYAEHLKSLNAIQKYESKYSARSKMYFRRSGKHMDKQMFNMERAKRNKYDIVIEYRKALAKEKEYLAKYGTN